LTARNEAERYYETSDQELAQRYIQDKPFLSREYCEAALAHRYGLYPFLRPWARFDEWSGKNVLEIGCGQGADLSQFAAHGARVFGADLTMKHCRITRDFVATMGAKASVTRVDATSLPYADHSFDLVYSFGVLLLVESLDRAIAEIHRVLRPGGTVMVMFYNSQSLHYYVKTLYYYGLACDLSELLGPRRLVDWFTDGYGYPRTYHQTPATLRDAFSAFTIDSVTVRNLTPDQIPGIAFDEYPPAFLSWLESRLGFYLLLRAHK
jgi:SAM-dependent methyltransferase